MVLEMHLPYQVEVRHEEHFTFKHDIFKNEHGQLTLIKDWGNCTLRGDVRSWLEQNTEKQWRFEADALPVRGKYTFVEFESESDAVLFKTTWC